MVARWINGSIVVLDEKQMKPEAISITPNTPLGTWADGKKCILPTAAFVGKENTFIFMIHVFLAGKGALYAYDKVNSLDL